MEKRHFVFLCHNSKDKVEVDEIRKRLQQRLQQDQIKLWLDKYDLEPLKHWEEQIEKLISHAFCAPIFVGSSGLGPYQKKEVEKLIGIGRNNPNFRLGLVILPSCLDDPRNDSDIPEDVKGYHWIDFHQDEPDPIEQLVSVITQKDLNHPPILDLDLKSNSPSQGTLEWLNILKKNKEVKAQLFKRVAVKAENEFQNLLEKFKAEESRIKELGEAIERVTNQIKERSSQETKEVVSWLERMSSYPEQIGKFTLRKFPEVQSHLTEQEKTYVYEDIGDYIKRISNSILTGRESFVQQPNIMPYLDDVAIYIETFNVLEARIPEQFSDDMKNNLKNCLEALRSSFV